MCFINKYRKGVTFPKRILEDIIYRIRYTRLYFQNNYQVRTVLFYPAYPSKRSVLYKILGVLKYNRTNNPTRKFDLAIHWDPETYQEEQPVLNAIQKEKKVLNIRCHDVSKKQVEKIHQEVFGYSTRVDPLTFHGRCVRKSNMNAMHDGQVIECPVRTVEPDLIYQILINNQIDDDHVEDIRTPVIGDEIPLVTLKFKSLVTRFGGFLKYSSKKKPPCVVSPADIFSDDERDKIILFAKRIGLDYCELDILRNRDDGRIYIVDANNIPTGPSHLDKETLRKALTQMAESFHKQFL
jgi:hypothetical protein